jgi:hypothetical protein
MRSYDINIKKPMPKIIFSIISPVRFVLMLFFAAANLSAQSTGVFNFMNATEVSNLPTEAPPQQKMLVDIEKYFVVNEAAVLFNADELRFAHKQLSLLHDLYVNEYDAVLLWKETMRLLFFERKIMPVPCLPLTESLLAEKTADVAENYYRLLNDALGIELYENLQFCLSYMGLSYTDWELWEAYVSRRLSLIDSLQNNADITTRLKAFIMAVDAYYSLCKPNEQWISLEKPLKKTAN